MLQNFVHLVQAPGRSTHQMVEASLMSLGFLDTGARGVGASRWRAGGDTAGAGAAAADDELELGSAGPAGMDAMALPSMRGSSPISDCSDWAGGPCATCKWVEAGFVYYF